MSARRVPPPTGQGRFEFEGTSEQEAAFKVWLKENPRVWAMFVRFSLEAVEAGLEHYSADAVLHRVRWESAVRERDGEWACNNNHTAYLAREFHQRYPKHRGFFRLRKSRADQEMAV